eukprot:g2015.t1
MLQSQIQRNIIHEFAPAEEGTYYNLFYTVYAWTNCAMSLLAGVLVDRIGTIKCAFLFLSFCIVGQTLYGIAPLLDASARTRYITMFVGRFIFGLGGGSITIAQNAITASWFKNKELAMAFGFTLTASRVGSVINFNLTPWLYNSFLRAAHPELLFPLANNGTGTFCEPSKPDGNDWPHALNSTQAAAVEGQCRTALGQSFLLGAGLICISLFFAALYAWYEIKSRAEPDDLRIGLASGVADDEDAEAGRTINDETGAAGGGGGGGDNDPGDERCCGKARNACASFPATFWVVAVIITLFYNLVFPFLADANAFIESKWGYSEQDAGHVSSIVYLCSMIASPFLGKAVDLFGRRGYLALFGTGISVVAFFLFGATTVNPILPMVLVGIAYCVCAAALWPSIQYLVDLKYVGTANGIATSMQMLGIGICNIVVGAMYDANKRGPNSPPDAKGWEPIMYFFGDMAMVACAMAVVLCVLDRWTGQKLFKGQRDKKREQETARWRKYSYGDVSQEEAGGGI